MVRRAWGIVRSEVFARHGEHAAGAGRWVVDGAYDAGLGEDVVILNEQQVDHETDDFARGEMLSGGLVGDFSEFADELFEDQTHLAVGDFGGMEVDLGEALGDHIEQAGFGEAVDLGVELEALEDIAHGGREGLNVGEEVFADVVLVAHQLLHVEGRGVAEALPGFAKQERLGVEALLFAGGVFGEDGGLGGLQNVIETAQNGEWQDDFAVFGLFVVAAEEVGDGPDEG
jgi:hypothetical protein